MRFELVYLCIVDDFSEDVVYSKKLFLDTPSTG